MAPRKPARPQRGTSRGHSKVSSRNGGAQGELRIIGGDWRSRKVRFPDAGGVRPTPARTRETLFNWLNYQLAGSRCLDLFAGSGALGLEALSRGAGSATFVDHTPTLTQALRSNLRALEATSAEVVCAKVDDYLNQPAQRAFDIVFMDPPFRQGWLEKLFPMLHEQGWVKPGSWVYVEHESELTTPSTPEGWHLHRQKSAGQVSYNLYQVQSAGRSE
ncbi:16S rRNA (guanine(966)-N(2))-methyltransferase RsmD [Marinobacter salinisoli]|uniref:Ribosomal RNA small subunit methyltransferase D n=1 Tax=Marinobacter salinisoli TaxID=2769486 RepID=A0ABX7MYW8_9GAMM|nr:16S rRNA (guanine(966)-N(2))-methyltransferase RsmD [Marinobacter salinisoli]QSP95388.1 16S rRNA (guanine(966)-N(2))-methyltransferase RsmD [Marinobacter salinisoli]